MSVGVDVDRFEASGAGEGRFARPVPAAAWEERQELRALQVEADRYRALADLLQRELERVTHSREEFDVLAEVTEARQAAIARLEQRLAAQEASLVAAVAERDSAIAAVEAPAEAPADPAPGTGARLLGRFERVRAGVQRAAGTATVAVDNQRLTAEVGALRDEMARRTVALDAARAQAVAAETEAETARAAAGAAQAEAESARAESAAAQAERDAAHERAATAHADAETARAEAAALRAELEAVANAIAAQAAEGAPAHGRGDDLDGGRGRGRRPLATALVALLLLALVAVVAVLILTGYGSYCSGHPCH